jgi:hypothetical protein
MALWEERRWEKKGGGERWKGCESWSVRTCLATLPPASFAFTRPHAHIIAPDDLEAGQGHLLDASLRGEEKEREREKRGG